jgi:hypothetical protein
MADFVRSVATKLACSTCDSLPSGMRASSLVRILSLSFVQVPFFKILFQCGTDTHLLVSQKTLCEVPIKLQQDPNLPSQDSFIFKNDLSYLNFF